MRIVKLRKIASTMAVTLPPAMVEALHLHQDDEVAIEVVGDRIVLTRATPDFQDAWDAYQKVEPRYRHANHRLAE